MPVILIGHPELLRMCDDGETRDFCRDSSTSALVR